MYLAKLTIAALTFSALALAADPSVGRWIMIPEKSTSEGIPMPKSLTVVFEEENGGLKQTVESIGPDGKAYKATMMVILDGKDHPYDDPDKVCDTAWGRRIDAQHTEGGCKGKGKELIGTTAVLSKSNGELTLTQFGKVPEMKFKQVFVLQRQR